MDTAEERELFVILVDHDVAIAERNTKKTDLVWPDLSDIHTRTRERIMALYGGNMRKIKSVTVVYENDATEIFVGVSGSLMEHTTVVKGDKPGDDRPVTWYAVTFSLLRQTSD